jgi:hypothetical protein
LYPNRAGQVEVVRRGQAGGLVIERGPVGRDGHVDDGVRFRDPLHRQGDFLPAPVKLLPELRYQGVHALPLHPFEGLPRAVEHQPFHQPDRGDHRHREDQKQTGAERHG